MADGAGHSLKYHDITRKEELKCSEYTCAQCMELENKLKNALEELKSTRLIIELLQHELSSLTQKLTLTGSSNTPQETSNHHINNEWVKVNHRCHEPITKDNLQKNKNIASCAN
jgi:hypothetical protein